MILAMSGSKMFLAWLFSRGIRAYGSMRFRNALLACCLPLILTNQALPQSPRSGNPILPGWYADPEAHIFQKEYWIYPTYSAPYSDQLFMDAFSSKDLVMWKKHSHVLDVRNVRWAKRALWAPSVVHKDGWYYLFFGANDLQNDHEVGGIGVARSRRPDGPFKDYLGKPLIGQFHNGAQPIDPFVFEDHDGAYYITYGGWQHCNIAKLNDDFTGFIVFADGTKFKEITPQGYVEGSFMIMKDGKYYFMWSEGGWTGPNYAVAYAVASSPSGLSIVLERSCSRTHRSLPAPVIILFCMCRVRTNGTSCITEDR
jgi:beta-xylosidase